MKLRGLVVSASLASVVACGGGRASFGPNKVDIPVSDGSKRPSASAARRRESPPASGTAKEAPFPAVARAKLGNGMGVDVVTSRALPIVQVRLFIRAGSGFGSAPGVATLTGDMLKDGGTRALSSAELLRRIETLGTNLAVQTDFDGTVLSLGVTKDLLGEALSLLSQVVREPRFDGGELKKLKSRTIDETEDALRSSGSWTATWIAFHELFGDKHPYGTLAALPSQIAKVDAGEIRAFYRKFYVPKAATLVVAGDVDAAAGKAAAEKAFGGWTGADPPKVDVPPMKAPKGLRIVVAHRKNSVQSDVFLTMKAPPRGSDLSIWAPVRVANQVLGGGVASRLFNDVREQRSLAYRTSSRVFELAHGAQPLVLYAGTQTPKTKDAVQGLLENVAKMRSSPPTAAETESARRYLSDLFAIRLETIGSISDIVATAEELGLPDGYWDAYRRALRQTEAPQAAAAAKQLFDEHDALLVVSGDADAIGGDLATLGEVTVVDPEREFATIKTIPAAHGAAR